MRTLFVVSSLFLVACGGGESRPDASIIVQPDAPLDAPKPCGATPAYGTVTPMDEIATRSADTNPEEIYYDAAMNTDTKFDDLSLQLFKGLGAFTTGEIVPGVVALSGAETNYETCGACVLIYVDLDPDNDFADDGVYMASGGTINLMTLSPNIKGTLSNVQFTHVTIDADTFHSTPVGDCQATVTSMAFDFPVTTDVPPPAFVSGKNRLRKH
jgi:hypothetical protein